MALRSKLTGKVVVNLLGVLVGMQRGAERYVGNAVCEFSRLCGEECVFVTNRFSAPHFADRLRRDQLIVVPISGKNRVIRMLVECLFYPVALRLFSCRLFVSTSLFPLYDVGCRTMIVLQDLLIFHYPHLFNGFERLFRQALIRHCARVADAIVTVSHWSREDIDRKLRRRPGGRVYVVPNAADALCARYSDATADETILESLGLRGSIFFLAVLGGMEYKNVHRLVEAFARLEREMPDAPLLLVVGDAERLVSRMACPPKLRSLGVVPDETLVTLYRNSVALVYPSLFEGFGIPVIEAQRLGVPVVASEIPVLVEVSGGAAIFVDPKSIESIAAGMRKALTQRQDLEFMRRAQNNSSRYTWRQSAEALWAACQSELEATNGLRSGASGLIFRP